MSIGPKTTIKRSCFDCEVCQTERYSCQGDSGTDVYCAHPSLPKRRIIGDTQWDTPTWCPAQPEITARADAEIAALRELLIEARDCVASDINYTLAQSHHEPAAIDYLRALLAQVDAAINGEGGGNE